MLLVVLVPDQPLVAAPPGVVNKTELATILRTSLPTIDRLLRTHGEAFPVIRRGGTGSAYEFDPAAVIEFLRAVDDARIADGRARDDLVQQYTLPEIVPADEPTLSPRDRLSLAKLRQIERDEKIRDGFLVETALVRAALYSTFLSLRNDMRSSVRQVLRESGTPEAVIRTIESRIADAQAVCVRSIQEKLRTTDYHQSSDQESLF
jgi:phage terminase Nu1 subunit (DNA packaging protein)